MAIAVVNSKHAAGGGAHGTVVISAATAGNLLVAFLSQLGTTAPTGAGWTIDEAEGHHALGGASANSLWLATRTASGGETEIAFTAGGTGILEGVDYYELSGASTTIDAIVKVDNPSAGASLKTVTSGAVTTSNPESIVLGAVGTSASVGTVSAWTGTGPMTNIDTLTTRVIGGSYLPGTTLTGATFTANWETSRSPAMLVVAFKPSGGISFSGSITQAFGLSNVVAGFKAAASAVAETFGLRATIAGQKLASAATTQTIALQRSLAGNKLASNSISQRTAQLQVQTGLKSSASSVAQSLATRSSVSGSKSAASLLTQTLALRQTVLGSKPGEASGSIIQSFALRNVVGGSKGSSGPVAGRLGLSSALAGRKAGIGSLTQQTGFLQAQTGRKAASGAQAGSLGLAGSVAGRKSASGSVVGLMALTQGWVIIIERVNGNAIATVAVKYRAVATVAVKDEAETAITIKDNAEGQVAG